MTLKKMTDGRDPETGRFLAGNNGGGRQKGSRNKLGEAFIADVYAKWQARGGEALERMIDTDPGGFVRVVAQVLPDKLEVDVKHTISRIERVIVDAPLARTAGESRQNTDTSASPTELIEHQPPMQHVCDMVEIEQDKQRR
jgi:hypothetical protein